jgi:adenylate kinase
MRILITGTPGVGKTTVAKYIAKQLNHDWVNEKAFALKHTIGEWDAEQNELIIPLPALKLALNTHLKSNPNTIVEGHLLCETKLGVDWVIVLSVHPELLESRLEQRGYQPEKIMDNVFCEGIEYCLKHAARNYPKNKIIEVKSQKTTQETAELILTRLQKEGVVA